MRNLIVIILLCMVINGDCFAQLLPENNVPAAVKKEFANRFPDAVKSYWGMLKNDYEVNFINNDIEYSVTFDKNGKIVETEFKITENQLPEIIKNSIEKDFTHYKIYAMAKLEKADNSVYYMVELYKDKEKLAVLFSSKGEVKKKRDISNKKGNN